MAIINSYPTVTPTGSDLIIGTDVSVEGNPTKTFTIDSINALATGTPASGTAGTIPIFTSAVAVGDSTIVRSGSGVTSLYTFGGGTAINNTSITTDNLTTTGNTILGNAGTDTLTVNAASTFAQQVTIPATPSSGTDAASKSYVDGEVAGFLPLTGGTMSGNIILPDNVKLLIGSATGGDLRIYHDGSNSYVDEQGTGNLIIKGSTNVLISTSSGGQLAQFTESGSAYLYHSGGLRFLTSATGASVAGDLAIQGSSGTNGQLILQGNGVVNGVADLKLKVGGNTKVSVASAGTTFTGQINLAALNTAPASDSAAGTLGEIRFTADYIYVCTATDTWKRVAIAGGF